MFVARVHPAKRDLTVLTHHVVDHQRHSHELVDHGWDHRDLFDGGRELHGLVGVPVRVARRVHRDLSLQRVLQVCLVVLSQVDGLRLVRLVRRHLEHEVRLRLLLVVPPDLVGCACLHVRHDPVERDPGVRVNDQHVRRRAQADVVALASLKPLCDLLDPLVAAGRVRVPQSGLAVPILLESVLASELHEPEGPGAGVRLVQTH